MAPETILRQVITTAERKRKKLASKEGAQGEENEENTIPEDLEAVLNKKPRMATKEDRQAREEDDIPPPKRKGRNPKTRSAEEQYFQEQLLKSPERQQLVLQHLQKGYGGSKRRKAFGDVRRVNIVGEDLCDAILERMKPSLAKHEGCDIIDVNPGAGTWSRKLHEVLKPRTHILMEPDTDLYQPLLQPLLDAEDSKYVLFPKPGVIWAHLERVLSEKHLPHQKPLPQGDPRLEQPNDTLLFVANLCYHPKRAFKAFGSLTTLVLHQLMSAVRSHSLFHKYGTVRMLIWVTDEERLTPLPKHVAMRKKASLESEISCGKIEEVASSGRPIGVFRRDDRLDAEQTLKVLANMERLGISTPKGRETPMQKHLLEEKDKKRDTSDWVDDDRVGIQYHKVIVDLEAKFAAGEFQKYSDVPRNPLPSKKEESGLGGRKARSRAPFELSPEWLLLNRLRSRKKTEVNRGDVMLQYAARNDEIMDMQREIYNLKGPEYETRRQELFQLTREFKDDVDKLPGHQTRVMIGTHIDNEHLLRHNPPGLLFDRREVEPLKVERSDFFPHHELALLDFQPQAIWPVLRKDYPANYDVFEYIVATLFLFPGQSVEMGLKALWPGAYEWLVPVCPTLTNPYKGGDMDLSRFSVRCLSSEMLKEIMEGWDKWPWRPSRIELLGQLNSYESVDKDDVMKDGDMAHGL
ncbi:hypothetical protein LHYA1_G009195 [Lachnellula hyalina]|uniref:Mitochondrial transcription factor 1 n=1 Tax=Lachnellula hyalina TaxID=1316788 RepID=A0A8H8QT09_9HELO|nr:uncharacterized protein LHYA1_G009195 [Lachnellula hyalina]TVY22238.1 hypothetical protein LHYA1_G009195 [Lachnellula hyalina]